MIKKIIKTALIGFAYGASICLAYIYGHRVGGKVGFRDGHVRGYWLGREVECYLRERINEYTNGKNESEVK